jgi:hypothetical protein
MKITFALLALLIGIPMETRADGPSTYETAGMVDGIIKICSEAAPEKSQIFKAIILNSFSCETPIADMEMNIAQIRESKNPEIRRAYKEHFEKIQSELKNATKKQKMEFCEQYSSIKC